MRNFLKYLPAVLLVQALTALLVYTIMRSENLELRITVTALCLGIGVLAAFWLSAISAAVRADAIAKVEERFARSRERLKVKAEKEKTKLVQENQRALVRERQRSKRKADIKAATSLAGVVGVGALLLFSQFLTLGLMVLGTGGGAVGGYLLRLKQERNREKPQLSNRTFGVSGLLTRRKTDESEAA